MYTIPHTHTNDIEKLQSTIREYNEGKLDEDSFKAARTPMGVYEQRKDKTYLVRVRCAGGYISPVQLQGLAEIAQQAGVPYFHITTRQEIQFHYVTLPWVKTILDSMEDLGLSSKGGGGNTVRNILVDIRSGIDPDEPFEVYSYAVDLTTFLIAQEDSFTLPRKLKIAFDISEEKADYAIINDLGFIPRILDGKKGFKVYVGGSVASKPTTGWVIHEFVPEEDLLHVAYAVKRFFSENGDRKNRHTARIRHIFYRLGEEETIRLIRQYIEQVKAENKFPYIPSSLQFQHRIPEEKPVLPDYIPTFERWKKRYTTSQKQDRLYAVMLPVPQGSITPETLRKLADFLSGFGNDVIRFTTRQHIQIRNIPEDYLPNIWQLFRELGFETELPRLCNDIISCTGADTCRLGTCSSQGAAKAVRKKLIESGLQLDDIDAIRVNISGCINSCSQQFWSDIGFSGRVARGDKAYPAYTVYAKTAGDYQLGTVLGVISAKDLPDFCTGLFEKYLGKKKDYPSFRLYIEKEGITDIEELIRNYSPIPTFEEDKNYYFDWGATEIFGANKKNR